MLCDVSIGLEPQSVGAVRPRADDGLSSKRQSGAYPLGFVTRRGQAGLLGTAGYSNAAILVSAILAVRRMTGI